MITKIHIKNHQLQKLCLLQIKVSIQITTKSHSHVVHYYSMNLDLKLYFWQLLAHCKWEYTTPVLTVLPCIVSYRNNTRARFLLSPHTPHFPPFYFINVSNIRHGYQLLAGIINTEISSINKLNTTQLLLQLGLHHRSSNRN